MNKRTLLAFLAGILFSGACAQDKSAELRQAAATAVNTGAQVKKFLLQPNYYIFYGGGNQLDLVTRTVVPYDGILLPFFKPKNKTFSSLARVELPVVSQTYGARPELNATGLGDMLLIEIVLKKTKWGKYGIGPAFGFPTSTSPVLGSGKWTAGLNGLIVYNSNPSLVIAVLVQQYFSYAGSPSRPDRNYMLCQPTFNYIFGKGFFVSFSPILTLDWKADAYTIPFALGIGKALAKNLSVAVLPQYVLTGPTAKSMVIQFSLTSMFR